MSSKNTWTCRFCGAENKNSQKSSRCANCGIDRSYSLEDYSVFFSLTDTQTQQYEKKKLVKIEVSAEQAVPKAAISKAAASATIPVTKSSDKQTKASPTTSSQTASSRAAASPTTSSQTASSQTSASQTATVSQTEISQAETASHNQSSGWNQGSSGEYTLRTNPAQTPSVPTHSPKNRWLALVLCVCLGFFGVHYFYVGRWKKGTLYIFTLGFLYIGWLIDILIVLFGYFKDSDGLYLK